MEAVSYRIRDPVHGFVQFDQVEKSLIDSSPFQRLRRIKQLAMTHLVYPGAVHTRFEHSIGVMEVATQLFDSLVERGGSRLKAALRVDSPDELARLRRTLRIAALLHDVGHAPFSHASEDLLPEGHEGMTARIMKDSELRDVLEKRHYQAGLHMEDIVPVALEPKASGGPLDARSQFLNELITGVFGADRIDYLLRDSLHAGVKYGQFDASRLIQSLTFVEDPETGDPVIALDRGGIHAAEGLILARYFMYQQVYFHKTRRIYDHHLLQFLEGLLPDGHYPQEAQEYLKWDDTAVEQEIQRQGRLGSNEAASVFYTRGHYRMVFQAPEGSLESYMDQVDDLRRGLADTFGNDVYVDALVKPLAPTGGPDVLVVSKGSVVSTWEAESKLFSTLPPLGFFRVYARNDGSVKKAVEDYCQGFFGVRSC